NGHTALHWASGRNRTEVVGALLRAGADASLKNRDGETPLDIVKNKLDPMVALLEGRGRS
ncbi:hypothetical protein TSOC_015118, partial [Tetrabaena socialis]